jgi:hypothetical protein
MPVTSLNVLSPDVEPVFRGRRARLVGAHHANSLGELRGVLERCLDDAPSPVTLDLIGHSTRDHHLLRLGQTPIDMLDPQVARFFRELATTRWLERLEVVAVRLLGCETVATDSGRRTLRLLSRTLRLPVFGTTKPVGKNHYNERGFDPEFARILVEAAATTRTGSR